MRGGDTVSKHSPHLITRGNGDGIICAAQILRIQPKTKIHFVTHATEALELLRSELYGYTDVTIADINPTEPLLAELNIRAELGSKITYYDDHYHQHYNKYHPKINWHHDYYTSTGGGIYQEQIKLSPILAALSELTDKSPQKFYDDALAYLTESELQYEAHILDEAWRWKIHDDKYRHSLAQHLSKDKLPSQHNETLERSQKMIQHEYWEKARQNAHNLQQLRQNIAIYHTQEYYRTPLYGYGSRALQAAAEESDAHISLHVHETKTATHIKIRHTETINTFDVGEWLKKYTVKHGNIGGGHPGSASGHIPATQTKHLINKLIRDYRKHTEEQNK